MPHKADCPKDWSKKPPNHLQPESKGSELWGVQYGSSQQLNKCDTVRTAARRLIVAAPFLFRLIFLSK